MSKIHIVPDWHSNALIMPQYNDSIHQARLFLSQGQAVNFILLDYVPRLRTMLHEKRLTQSTYWSFFDVIQEVDAQEIGVYGLYDFSWPTHAYFVEMADGIFVYDQDQLYAQIILDSERMGQIVSIKRFSNDILVNQCEIDDRGFVSRVNYFEQDQLTKSDFLTPNGDLALQVRYQNGQLVGATTKKAWQGSKSFNTLQELMLIVLKQAATMIAKNDQVVETITAQSPVMAQVLPSNQPVVYSDYNHQTVIQPAQQVAIGQATLVVAQNEQLDRLPNRVTIPLFSADLDEGLSQQSAYEDYYWVVGETTLSQQEKIFNQLVKLAVSQPKVRVMIDTKQALAQSIMTMISENAELAIDEDGLTAVEKRSQLADSDDINVDNWHYEGAIEAFKKRFIIHVSPTEEVRDELMKQARVLIDLNQIPNQYLQTAALTTMIPQINVVVTPYLEANKNGLLIQDVAELAGALDFYRQNIRAWANAKNEAYKLAQKYYATEIWQLWERVFDHQLSHQES